MVAVGPNARAVTEPRVVTEPRAVSASHAVTEPLVAFDEVTVAYRSREVLHGVSFRIDRGERLALLGPNGAGKSTILRALLGVVGRSHGSIRLDGRPIGELSRLQIARRVAVVPQQASLPFAARVEDVVALGRLPHEHPLRGIRPVDRAAIAGAIDRVGVGHLLGRDAAELSLGERQLVLLAMALAQGAELLVLDEPTAHLDLRHQVQVMELLTDLNERDGVTIVGVLHDLALAGHFFPRVLLIDRGTVIGDGPSSEVLTADRVRDVFGVDPTLVGILG
ncbi:MAG: ABC transporter ATP-binding protein [Chloroflexota bacterium]|nr:ABC transporter ATP-binding protein [Chloroflexota bacterium]